MSKSFHITAAIVLFEEDKEILLKTIASFLNLDYKKKLFLIDNSKTDRLRSLIKSDEVEYIFNNKNLGFAKANNLILDKIKDSSNYHLVLNPDVEFSSKIITPLILQLEDNNDVAMIAPKVIYNNNNLQFTCRRYPSFFDLINRRINLIPKKNNTHHYKDIDLEKPFFPDFIHGCFMLFKTKDFVSIKGFDERYFLYMEDADICKKIDISGKKKMYYPHVSVKHLHRRASTKSFKLLYQHFISAFKYFLKWKTI